MLTGGSLAGRAGYVHTWLSEQLVTNAESNCLHLSFYPPPLSPSESNYARTLSVSWDVFVKANLSRPVCIIARAYKILPHVEFLELLTNRTSDEFLPIYSHPRYVLVDSLI